MTSQEEFNENYPSFDSSDIDVSIPDEAWKNVGQKSIGAMLAKPFSRAESKKRVKELQVGKSWNERYCCYLWYNRLDAFRKQLLKKEPNSIPTHEDIIRFAMHCASCRLGRGKDGAMNYDTMRHGIDYIHKMLTFKYDSYTVSRHSSSRIEAALFTLVDEGELTRELTRSREPAGAIVVRRLVLAIMKDAILKGTNSWNDSINDVAMIVLTSCFNSRSGDLMGDIAKRKDRRPDLPGLRYADLHFIVGDGGTLKDIESKNKMRNSKGMKDDEEQFFYLYRKALPDGADNILCPVKLVLVQALRSGNTFGTTIQDVLEHAKRRPDRRIVWRFPSRPVLCGANEHGVLDWDILALKQKASRALNRANSILGSTMNINMHLLRFGAADDLQAVRPTATSRPSMDAISDQLAHHPGARLKGVALTYAQAYTTDDHWGARVQLSPSDLPFNRFVAATDE